MKLFIGWSGERSQAMAFALREWLPLVLHYVEPWLSETDIAAGERWADAIAKELEASNFGIMCVTRENVSSPWILFEAGSLAKSLASSHVIPLLLDLDLSEVSGPLAQFQAKKTDEEGLNDTIQSINRAAQKPLQDGRPKQLFDALWPDFQKKLAAIPAPKQPTKPMRSQQQVIEELVASVRSLESRIREVLDIATNQRIPPSRRFRRVHPMMLREMVHFTGVTPGDPLRLLMLASFVREELPWLYELAIDVHRATRAGNQSEATEAIERFSRAFRFLLDNSPLVEEAGIDPRFIQMMCDEMEQAIRPSPTPDVVPQPKKRRK